MALKDALGEEGYAELVALLQGQPAAPSKLDELRAWFLGSLKSWTMRFGVILMVAPDILPELLPQLQEFMTANTYKRVLQFSGILMVLLRWKTKVSLIERGKA